jgi:hypothetical protein
VPAPDELAAIDPGTGDVDGLGLGTAEVDHVVDIVAKYAQHDLVAYAWRQAQSQFRTV